MHFWHLLEFDLLDMVNRLAHKIFLKSNIV